MSDTFKMSGTFLEIFDEQQVSEKFRKREFVLEVQDGQYPQQVKFQLVQDKVTLLDGYKIGDSADVSFNVKGRGFNKNGQMMYFTSLEAWKVEAAGGAQAAPAGNGFQSANKNPALRQQPGATAEPELDQLPF